MRWNTDYQRVIPRDLFNEAKLLKCLGFVSLWIHEGKLPGLVVEERYGEAGVGNGFDIRLLEDGYLYCESLCFRIQASPNSEPVEISFVTTYNSKSPWPLLWSLGDGNTHPVFTEDGGMDPDFKRIVQMHSLHQSMTGGDL